MRTENEKALQISKSSTFAITLPNQLHKPWAWVNQHLMRHLIGMEIKVLFTTKVIQSQSLFQVSNVPKNLIENSVLINLNKIMTWNAFICNIYSKLKVIISKYRVLQFVKSNVAIYFNERGCPTLFAWELSSGLTVICHLDEYNHPFWIVVLPCLHSLKNEQTKIIGLDFNYQISMWMWTPVQFCKDL